MLILAGISISFVIGKNGVFTKSKASSEKYSEASIIEELQMILGRYILDKENGSDKTGKEYLVDNGVPNVIDNDETIYKVTYKGFDFIVKKDTLEIVNKNQSVKVDRLGLNSGDYINYISD